MNIAERHTVVVVCRVVPLGQERQLHLVELACIRDSSQVPYHGRGTRGNVNAIQSRRDRFLAVGVDVCLIFYVEVGPVAEAGEMRLRG